MTRSARAARRVLTLLAALAAVLLSTLPVVAPPAAAAEPLGLFAGDLSFELQQVTPAAVTRGGGNLLTVAGAVTNTGDSAISDLIVRFQRGDALRGETAVAAELSDPSQPTAVISGDWSSFSGDLAPGESTSFRLTAPVTGEAAGSLGITAPGIYPLMANVNGTRDVDGTPSQVRVGELHLVLTVSSLPAGTSTAATTAANGPDGSAGTGTGTRTGATTPAVPVGLTWPISSVPHRGVGGVFTDDSLADEIGPGGRLTARLDALQQARLPAGSVVLVVDPMLLDELDAMSRGYRVQVPGATPVALDPATGTSVEAPRTDTTGPATTGTDASTATSTAASSATTTGGAPSSTATPTAPASGSETGSDTAAAPALDTSGTVAGTHQQSAADFLARLRQVAASSPVVLVPYSDPDTVSLAATGRISLLRTLRARGAEVAARVLGRSDLRSDVGLPPDALTDPATVDGYRAAGYRSLLLSRTTVSGGSSTGGVGRVSGARASLPALVGDDRIQPLLAQVLDPPTGRPAAAALNGAVALLAARHQDGTATPVLQLPGSIVDVGGLSDLGSALDALAGDGVTGSVDVSRLTRGAPSTPDLQAVLPAGSSRLPTAYLDDWSDTCTVVDATASVIAPPGAVAGRQVVTALQDAVDPLASASLRTAPGRAATLLSSVTGSVQRIQGGVLLRTTAGSYTLASADSPLVLTIQNQLPFPVTVGIRITGGLSAGLQVTVPASVLVEGKRSKQISLPTSVARAGTFSISVQLTTAGTAAVQPWGTGQRIEIRSNAYGALTLVLVIGAGGVLFLMVGLRLWQRWRERGTTPEVADEGDSIAAMATAAAAERAHSGGERR